MEVAPDDGITGPSSSGRWWPWLGMGPVRQRRLPGHGGACISSSLGTKQPSSTTDPDWAGVVLAFALEQLIEALVQ